MDLRPRGKSVILAAAACLLAATASTAAEVFRRHQYSDGETVRFMFEDTDTVFLTTKKDGTIQAGDPVKVQEIRIPVFIEVSSSATASSRRLTISPLAASRSALPARLSDTPFKALNELDPAVPASFSYSYRDDTDALDHLQKTFEGIRKSETGSLLFYKMEDVHQMQESAERIPEGMSPGQSRTTARHEREGLGGKFIAAPAQMIFQSTETFNGTQAGYFKVISLGHEFSGEGLKTYTNFFFTMHVALEGPKRGLLLFGEGQETATVLKDSRKGLAPLVILQRQFSIRRLE